MWLERNISAKIPHGDLPIIFMQKKAKQSLALDTKLDDDDLSC